MNNENITLPLMGVEAEQAMRRMTRRSFAFGKYFERRDQSEQARLSSGAVQIRCELQHQALDFAFRFGRAVPPRTSQERIPRIFHGSRCRVSALFCR